MFADRRDAGRKLAARLASYAAQQPVVIGLPRGGLPVAAEVAKRLGAPLDVIVVRKLGAMWQPELGIGAIAEGGIRILNDAILAEVGMSHEDVEEVTTREREELERRVSRYRGNRQPMSVAGRPVILVDDGLATGYTARAAIEALRRRGAGRVILAVPVAPLDSVRELQSVADEVIAIETPTWFLAIGEWYEDFTQTSDEDVASILAAARAPAGRPLG
jgi:putative phosphoribosyl transferase